MDAFTYDELLNQAGFDNYQQAYQARQILEGQSTRVVLNSPLTSGDDLARVIHMVYAWMPKMLKTFNDNATELVLSEMYHLAILARNQVIAESQENRLFITLASLTNNHMVGASKVLTVINPDNYPIFDKRVVTSWNLFFDARPHLNVNSIKNLSITKAQEMIKNYRYYKDKLQVWATNIGLSPRDIEYLFWKVR